MDNVKQLSHAIPIHMSESLSEWYIANDDNEWLVIDLERIFEKRCNDFIDNRLKNGFSESTYVRTTALRISIVDDSSFGAKAVVNGEQESIEINRGTLNFILWLSLKCIINEAFPAPDTADGQKISRRHRADQQSDSLIGSYDVPRKPLHRALAVELAFFTFQLILFHELGHLAQNHCRLLSSGAFYDYTEKDSPNDHSLNNSEIQSLEFMADLFAIRELLIYMRSARDELFPGAKESVRNLTLQGEALHYCIKDQFFSYVAINTILAVTYYMTSSKCAKHPERHVRFLATALAAKTMVEAHLGWAVTPDHIRASVEITDIVGETVAATVPAGETFEHIASILKTPHGSRTVKQAIDGYRSTFALLEPKLKNYPYAEKAFIKFECT